MRTSRSRRLSVGASERRALLNRPGRVEPAAPVVVVVVDPPAGMNDLSDPPDEHATISAPFLEPGTYILTIEKSGFKRFQQQNIELQTLDRVRVDIRLEVGSVTESVNVNATVAALETDFQISQGTVHTSGLRIQQLDGLGDATAPNGNFRIDSALILNYAATVVLTPEATSRVKSLSPALGLVVTILETNNRVSVPINVSGDVRNPEVQVDVSRIF